MSRGPAQVELGMVHGRFQPFHNGHLEYALGAARRCRHLMVGITNPDPTHVRMDALNPARSDPEANPFPYHVRYRMVRAAFEATEVDSACLSVVPFPIHQPDLWRFYAPERVVHFVRIFSEWESAKLDRLRAAGYTACVLDEGTIKRISGTEVRRLMRVGGPWQQLVPPGVAALQAETLPGDGGGR